MQATYLCIQEMIYHLASGNMEEVDKATLKTQDINK